MMTDKKPTEYTYSQQGWGAWGPRLYYIFFNGCILFYFFVIQPFLLTRLDPLEANPGSKDVAMGVGLLVLQVLEVMGLWLKYPLVRRQAQKAPGYSSAGSFFLIVIMYHVVITILIGVVIQKALLGFVSPSVATLCIFKEILLFIFLFVFLDTRIIRGKISRHTPVLRRHLSYLADWFLMLFSVVAYTIVLEPISISLHRLLSGARIQEYIMAAMFFCLLYPGTRPLGVAETWLIQRSRKERIVSVITFLAIMISAIAGKR